MEPAKYDLTGEKKGSRFLLPLILQDENAAPVNMTGWTAQFIVRTSFDSQYAVLTASTANGKITLNSTPYNLIVDIDLVMPAGKYVYDLAVFDTTGRKWSIMTGLFYVDASTV